MISDYTFDKDSIFAQINLNGDELEMYHRVHEALAEKIPPPDLVVYLRADTEVLLQRIALRDRSYERYMERSYIDQLNQAYEAYFGGLHLGSQPGAAPVLTIDSNHLDFVHRSEDLKLVEHRIRQALHLEPYQVELPLDFDRNE